jgi:hypothetical protein
MIEPGQVVPHHGTLRFGLVDAVSKSLVNDHFYRNAAVFKSLWAI